MHARVNNGRVEPNRLDEFVVALQPLWSRAKQQAQGLTSVMALGDRLTGSTCAVTPAASTRSAARDPPQASIPGSRTGDLSAPVMLHRLRHGRPHG